MNNLKVGQIVQVRYRYTTWERLTSIKIESIDDYYINGIRINRDQEYVKIHKNLIIKYHIIADIGQSVIHISELYKFWYDEFINFEVDVKKGFEELYPDKTFLRFDEESLYVVYKSKAEKINRLWGTLTYLIGSIDLCPDNGRTWRKRITPELLKRNIVPLDPLDKPIDLGIEDEISRQKRKDYVANGEWDNLASEVKIIRHVDLRLVDLASFIICYLDTSIPVCGTMEELFWANRLKCPVIVVCPQGKKNVPQWLFGTLKHELFFDNFEQMFEYLDYIDSSPNPAHLGRWLFVDYKKLYSQISPIT